MQFNSPRPSRAWARRATASVCVLALGLTLGACTDDPEPIPTPTVTVEAPVESDKEQVPEPELPTTWALTGVESDKIVDRPAVAVKIENTVAARPQSGLEDADVVWETIVEYGVSRYIGVFHSNLPEEIGPIRSARPIDLHVVSSLAGLFVFSGAQRGVVNLIGKSSDLQALSHDAGAAGLYRIGTRSAPHNVYGSLESFVDQAAGKFTQAPPEQFAFALEAEQAAAVLNGSKTSNISLRLSDAARPKWDWHAESSTWQRSEGSAPAMAASGDRLSATNVVLIEAESVDSGFKAGQTPIPDVKLNGTGKALIATGGKTLEVTWSKQNDASPLTLQTEDGESADLAPGNTWVELIPSAGGSYTLD